MPQLLKQPKDDDYNDPNIVLGYKYLKMTNEWQLFGYYCPHCSLRRLNPRLLREHVKTCKDTKKQLKAREGCYSWFNSKYGGHHQNINS